MIVVLLDRASCLFAREIERLGRVNVVVESRCMDQKLQQQLANIDCATVIMALTTPRS